MLRLRVPSHLLVISLGIAAMFLMLLYQNCLLVTLLIETPSFIIDSVGKLLNVIERGDMHLYTYKSYAFVEELTRGDEINVNLNKTRDVLRRHSFEFADNEDVSSFSYICSVNCEL